MPTGDTIVAIATPPGRADRALVRLSGPDAPDALAALTHEPPDARPGARRVTIALDTTTGPRTLPTLATTFAAPRSYTGEHLVELAVPGAPWLAERVRDTMLDERRGVRLAEPGEFTARAYLAGKLSAEQAEGVQAMIAARAGAELDAAARLLTGDTGARYRALADELTTLLALVEAGIDFTDEESVTPIGAGALAGRVGAALAEIRRLLGAGAEDRASGAGRVVVALAGSPNAGKSTLFNALVGRARSIVSSVPGATRDVVREEITLEGAPVTLCDLAGLDEALAATAIDTAAQRAAADAIGAADIVAHCDPSGRFDPLPGAAAIDPPRLIRVRTMADHAGSGGDLPVCALDGFNLGALARTIADTAASLTRPPATAGADAVAPRHRRALHAAADELGPVAASLDGLGHAAPIPDVELVATGLRLALDALGAIVGRSDPDDVLGRIYATFCLGK